jgi:hypothetical protein
MYKLYDILNETPKQNVDDLVNFIHQFDSFQDFKNSNKNKFYTVQQFFVNNYKGDPKYDWNVVVAPLKDKDKEEERKAKEKAKPNEDAENIKKVAQNYPQYDFSKATIYSKRVGETQKLRNFLDGLYCPKIDFITKEVHGFTNGNYLDKLLKKEVIGCEKCAADKNGNRLDISKEIEKYQTTYPENKYDFSQATWSYPSSKGRLWVKNIICRNLKNHDESYLFYREGDGVSWNQLYNQNKGGCPACLANRKSKGEKKVYYELEKLGYNFTPEKTFPGAKGCFSYKGQKGCNLLRFDAYIVKDGEEICIEFDGIQHYEPVERFGGEEGFIITQENDRAKNEYCKNNGIRLIRIPYWDYNKIGKILENEIGYNDKTKQPIAETQRLQELANITK